MSNLTIKITKIDSRAKIPSRNHKNDAGLDISSIESLTLFPLSRALIHTGLCLEIPDGYYGRIAPRSGLALKHGIDVLAGVVDSTYRGEICVILYNTSRDTFEIREGDKIAQLIIEAHYNMDIIEVSELEASNRGKLGFGSSGV
jgi:dUTP pyrophosphatase